MPGKKRKCCICPTMFVPHLKVGDRQKTCGHQDCLRALKQKNNAEWRLKNPDYGKNDYPRLKEWLDQNPGYLERYRHEHPDYVRKNRDAQMQRDRGRKIHLDIQAKLKRQPSDIMKQVDNIPQSLRLDIQDECILKPLEVTLLLSNLTRSACLDIQDKIAFPFYLRDNGTIKPGGGAYGCPMGH